MPGDPPQTAARPRRRWRWRWIGLGLATLALLRIVAPSIVEAVLEARLAAALGGEVEIDDVDLALWAGELTAEGLRAAPGEGASEVHVEALRLGWSWIDLLRGDAALEVSLTGVDATVDLAAPWPSSGTAAAGPRQGLWALRSLTVDQGRIAWALPGAETTLPIAEDLALRLDVDPGETIDRSMTANFEITARTGGDGRLTVDGALSPVAPREYWTLRFALDRLDLRTQNPLFRRAFELDVERGALSLHGELSSDPERIRGQVVPRFEGLRLLGADEASVRHPMAEALFGAMLSTADIPIDIDRARGRVDLEGLFDTDPMDLLARIVLQGYTRRLNTLEGHDATIDAVVVDFPAGLLSFRGITLTRSRGVVDEPFLRVPRMDVVVEASVMDPDAPTYKSVTLHGPHLVFVTGETPAKSQLTLDPEWQDKVSALPYPTDRLTVVDGLVEYRDDTTRPPGRFYLAALALDAEGLGRARAAHQRRGARVTAEAQIMGEGPVRLDMALSPGAQPLDAAIALHVDALPLARLNPLARARFGVDVSAGTLGLEAALDARGGRLKGTITPALADVVVLGSHEDDVDHPLRELLLERRLGKLDGATLELDVESDDLLQALPGALLSAVLRAS
ncbi:MAG: DUF748 domain-containing protein [Nannocystaceae bacterium]